MKLLQINTTVNTGSTGHIAEDIGQLFLSKGHESYIAHSRKGQSSTSQLINVGSKLDMYVHGLHTRVFDRHGFASKGATKNLISEIEDIQPNIIGLHNVHGYYIHVAELFEYLKSQQDIPVIWTLHDCWSFTGHCAYYSMEGCMKWKTHCEVCPLIHRYPRSVFKDNSFKNFEDKKQAFTGHENLTIVTPSKWLKSQLGHSFLQYYPVKVINNGIDLNQFHVINNEGLIAEVGPEEKIILGVASVWEERKGLDDFIRLSKLLPKDYKIILIGLNYKQLRSLTESIKGISRTEDINELVKWYNIADVFVNPTYEDNFPTTNIEALACGTPVITYNAGGSPEAIDDNTGVVVPKGDTQKLAEAIEKLINTSDKNISTKCRERAERLYNKKDRYLEYFSLYNSILA